MFSHALRCSRLHAPRPARPRQGIGRLQNFLHLFFCRFIVGHKITDAVHQAAPAPPLRFRPAQPAPEFCCFKRREMAGKGSIRRIKKMMALIEHDPPQTTRRCFLFFRFSNAERVVNGRLI